MSKLQEYDTANYELYILGAEDVEYLREVSLQAVATEGIIPNVYGVRSKITGCTEMYCYNLPAALSVQNGLEEGLTKELKERKPKKSHLATVH